MRVAVVNAQVPFVWGGAEEMSFHLTAHLRRTGIDAQLVRIPTFWEPAERLLDEALAARLLRLDRYDRVIGSKFPSYGIPHRDMRIWLVHQYRQAYDLWDAGASNIPDDPRGNALRQAIHDYDLNAFRSAKRLVCVAEPIRQRLQHYMGIDAPVCLVPVNDEELFADMGRENYIFAGGRVNGAKRQHLLVEALALTKSDVRLVICGPPDGPDDRELLEGLVDRLNLRDRVTLDLRFAERRALADYANNALAAAYLPFQEDSVGYVTAEAFLAHNPVLTTTDSGGVLDIVHDGETGYVRKPDPAHLAEAMDRFAGDRASCIRMGRNGHDVWRARGISWQRSVAMLMD